MPAGHLNPIIDELSAPPIPNVRQWIAAYDGALGPVMDFSQAVPGYAPHPKILRKMADYAGDASYSGYGPIEGELSLRDTYARYLSGLYQTDFNNDNIQITAGCNQAFIIAAMAIAKAGDTILLSNPCYFNHETSLQMLGINVETFDCPESSGFLPRPEALKAALTPEVKAVTLVSPNNPTGAICSPAELDEIFEICQAAGVWLILDETYREFLPGKDEKPHSLFQKEGWEDTLIQLYSFSKSFCIPGHRLGSVTAGQNLTHALYKIMDNLQICAPRTPQLAIADCFDVTKDWRDQNRLEILSRAAAFEKALAGSNVFEIATIGAYFSYLKHNIKGTSSERISQILAEKLGILTLPGTYFGRGQERYIRFAFANADIQTIEELPARLDQLKTVLEQEGIRCD